MSIAEKIRLQAEWANSTVGIRPVDKVVQQMIASSYLGEVYANFWDTHLDCSFNDLSGIAKELEDLGFYTQITSYLDVTGMLEVKAAPFEEEQHV